MPGETVTDLRKKFEPKEEAPKPRIEKSELKGLAEKRKYAEENWGVRTKQSQTPTPPKPEVTSGERGVKALKSGIESNIVAVDERWNKTIDFMKGQAPDEIIRVLSGMPDSVEQETKKRAVEVIEAARKTVADEVGKRIAESREMAKDFTEKWRGEQALKSARDRAGPVRKLLDAFTISTNRWRSTARPWTASRIRASSHSLPSSKIEAGRFAKCTRHCCRSGNPTPSQPSLSAAAAAIPNWVT